MRSFTYIDSEEVKKALEFFGTGDSAAVLDFFCSIRYYKGTAKREPP